MPFELFVDRLPFARPDGVTPLFGEHWRPWLPIRATNVDWRGTFSPNDNPLPWLLDTGHSGEASSFATHLFYGCGITDFQDPRHYMPHWQPFRTADCSRHVVLVRANLWLFSNLERFRGDPHRIPIGPGLYLMDSVRPAPADFNPDVPLPIPERLSIEWSAAPDASLIGMRALMAAGLKVEIDAVHTTVSVWRWQKLSTASWRDRWFGQRQVDIDWYPLMPTGRMGGRDPAA